jgi:aryl-alcohol dehydrogenase-like predicted oxidoreductase
MSLELAGLHNPMLGQLALHRYHYGPGKALLPARDREGGEVFPESPAGQGRLSRGGTHPEQRRQAGSRDQGDVPHGKTPAL